MTCGFAQADLDAIYGAMALDGTGWVVGFAPLMLGNIDAYGHFPQVSAPNAVNTAIQAYLDNS